MTSSVRKDLTNVKDLLRNSPQGLTASSFSRELQCSGSSVEKLIMEDITERKKMENALKQSYEALEIKVIERTSELTRVNADLEAQVQERRRAEEELRNINLNLANSQRIAHLGSFQWDLSNGRLIWSDEAYRIFGLEPGSEISCEKFIGFVHPDDRDRVINEINDNLSRGERCACEYRIIRLTGVIRYISSEAEFLFDSDGKPARTFGTMLDITERKQVERQIIQLNKDLNYNISELRGLLKDHSKQLRIGPLQITIGKSPDLIDQ